MANKVYGFNYRQDTEDKILTLQKFEMTYDEACADVQLVVMTQGKDLGFAEVNNFMNSLAKYHGYILKSDTSARVYCDSKEERDGAYNELYNECKDVEYAIIEKR